MYVCKYCYRDTLNRGRVCSECANCDELPFRAHPPKEGRLQIIRDNNWAIKKVIYNYEGNIPS